MTTWLEVSRYVTVTTDF